MRPLVLPWPPTVNTYFRSVLINGSVRVLISKDGRKYRETVRAAVWERFGALKPTRARLAVVVAAFPPDRRERDLDNLFKGLLDAVTHAGVWVDDSQIDLLAIHRCEVAKPGRVEMRIKRLTDEPAEQQLIGFGGLEATNLPGSGKR